jgi:D-methionine transport system ATP-binding protein
MIEIKNLEKYYDENKVLNGIDLQVKKGDVYGLIGISGSGKSTLLRCINGLENYTDGSLKVNGLEINSLNKKDLRDYRKNVSMIFQDFPLLSRKNIYENIALPMKCWNYSEEDINKRVKELSELVGITDKLKVRPHTLSGGQKQRVIIARALTMNPSLLLCDEATSALDPITTKSILKLLRKINKELGLTILIVTHQMEVIKQVCENVSLIENGVIAATGSVEDIFINQVPEFNQFLSEDNNLFDDKETYIQIMIRESDNSVLILDDLINKLNIKIKVYGGQLGNFRGKKIGSIIIKVNKNDLIEVENFLDCKNIIWHIINK